MGLPSPTPATIPNRQREFAFTEHHFRRIRETVYQYCGINLLDSKQDMVYSRLTRRLRATRHTSFDSYLDLALNDAQEFTELVNALTTNLTAFFRESHHFAYLARELVPQWLKRSKRHPIRIWSAGCSTGEEPYSIAITLTEHAPPEHIRQFTILATDVDHNVIQRAATGIYSLDRVAELDHRQRKCCFRRGRGQHEGKVKVVAPIRQLIEFQPLNLLAPWPFNQPFDLIFCRNVVIYFDKPTQQKLFTRIADQLVDGGHLFLGHSESLYQVSDRFEPLGQTIYRKRG